MTTDAVESRTEPVFAVSELVSDLRTVFAQAFGRIWVEGEVSGLYRSRLGHVYFDLRDPGALLKAVVFRRVVEQHEGVLEDGMWVRVRAQPDVYPDRGQLQLIVDRVAPAGAGALRAAFERLKRELEAEGLFEAAHKRALPVQPECVGIVTSLGGAALHDFVRALRKRRADLRVVVYDARVQGADAWRQLVRGMNLLASDPRVEVVVLARGGGSLEDLWSFNREELVRAIFALETPVISAVGHETDVVLSDWVADARAATPTAAADLVSVDARVHETQVHALARRLERAQRERLGALRERLRGLERGLVHPGERLRAARFRLRTAVSGLRRLSLDLGRDPGLRVGAARERLDGPIAEALVGPRQARLRELVRLLEQRARSRVETPGVRLERIQARLDALSPLRVLHRGYSIARRDRDGAILRSGLEVEIDEGLEIRLASGRIRARVTQRSGDA